MATVSSASSRPVARLHAIGQSVWMDTMSRKFLNEGTLARLIREEDLRGVTSNPSIFEKAIAQSQDYDAVIQRLAKEGADADRIYQELTVADIREALDLFLPVYERTQGLDGYVSLEVSPLLAHDTAGTLAEARMLWKALGRPNAMIKIPGTPEGLPAIEEALFEGININVTLLFSVDAYANVARTYVQALNRRAKAGLPVDGIASVASFFVSRIDAEVEKRLKPQIDAAVGADREALLGLLGTAANANAQNAYAVYQTLFEGPDFAELRQKGARVQRLLWASVGMKASTITGFALPDTLYIDKLIGPETVSTMPPETYAAFQDHGVVHPTLTEGLDQAPAKIARLAARGVDLADVTNLLLAKGVDLFADAFRQLMRSLETKRQSFLS